VKKGLKIKNDN